MQALRSRLSYANVMSTMALFVALGGGAYAAAKLPANSVGPTQLQDNAVSSSKVLDGSLLGKDFKAGQLPAGPQGPQGPPGPSGVSGLQVIYADSGPGGAPGKSAEAQCPSGKKVTGGGGLVAGTADVVIDTSAPGAVPNPTSWYVHAREFTYTGTDWTLYAYAVCATVGP